MTHTESALQTHCVAWFRWQYPKQASLLFSIPNGAHLHGTPRQRAAQWARLEREGALAGAADLFLAIPSGNQHGLFIEMKTAKGKQTPAQKAFQEVVDAQGYGYVIIKELDQFQRVVKERMLDKTSAL